MTDQRNPQLDALAHICNALTAIEGRPSSFTFHHGKTYDQRVDPRDPNRVALDTCTVFDTKTKMAYGTIQNGECYIGTDPNIVVRRIFADHKSAVEYFKSYLTEIAKPSSVLFRDTQDSSDLDLVIANASILKKPGRNN